MNEKVLARGQCTWWNPFSVTCFLIAALIMVVCFVVADWFWDDPMCAFTEMESGYYWFFIGAALFVILGIAGCVGFELVITESTVSGKTIFAKRVDLPINQISAIGTGMFSSIAIATSSGSINFYGIVNRDEMFRCLSELVKNRQNAAQSNVADNTSGNSLEELMKLKTLLDQGIITQEEFDAKKKQLLGL